MLTCSKKRLHILYERGVDIVVAERFTSEYMKMEYADFIKTYLVEKFDAKYVCAGFNYHFGYKGLGNTESLQRTLRKIWHKRYILQSVRLLKNLCLALF